MVCEDMCAINCMVIYYISHSDSQYVNEYELTRQDLQAASELQNVDGILTPKLARLKAAQN